MLLALHVGEMLEEGVKLWVIIDVVGKLIKTAQ